MDRDPKEYRRKFKVIRRAEYAEQLEACRRCGGAPQLFVIDPVGTWLKLVLPAETVYFAVRCACGETGACFHTGICASGDYVNEQHAAGQAARKWNAEQTAQTQNNFLSYSAYLKGLFADNL